MRVDSRPGAGDATRMNSTLRSVLLAAASVTALSSATPASADFAAGMEAARRGDFAVAVQEWTPLAKAGDAQAQVNLALMFELGASVDQDYEQSAHWYGLAAEQGDAGAQYHLGLHYQSGLGVAHDPVRAVALFQQSADQAHPGAMYELGYAFHEGDGRPKDLVQAMAWFIASAARGWSPSVPARNFTERQLTDDELAKADGLAAAWLTDHPRP